jgi:hypothetical protein
VPWSTIGRIERLGPPMYQLVMIHVSDRPTIIRSSQPNTQPMQARVASLVSGSQHDGQLLLSPWIAGLDGATLAGAIQRGITDSRPSAN